MARLPETSAGSESTAWMEKEASRNLGDPSRSSGDDPEYAGLRHIQRKADAAMEVGFADSTRSAGKPRTWGSGGQGEFLRKGHMSSTQRETNS